MRAEIDYYKKYNYQSQISNLPGGLKRNESEINDNYFPICLLKILYSILLM